MSVAATTENNSEPHVPQRVWFPSGSPQTSSVSAPCVTTSFSRDTPAKGLNAEPVEARQFEQWQFSA
jgi:hypothetical protein